MPIQNEFQISLNKTWFNFLVVLKPQPLLEMLGISFISSILTKITRKQVTKIKYENNFFFFNWKYLPISILIKSLIE